PGERAGPRRTTHRAATHVGSARTAAGARSRSRTPGRARPRCGSGATRCLRPLPGSAGRRPVCTPHRAFAARRPGSRRWHAPSIRAPRGRWRAVPRHRRDPARSPARCPRSHAAAEAKARTRAARRLARIARPSPSCSPSQGQPGLRVSARACEIIGKSAYSTMVTAAGVAPTATVARPVAEPAVAVITAVPFATAVTTPFASTVATAVSELDLLAMTCWRVLPPYCPATLPYAASWRVPPGAAMAEDWVPTACTTRACGLPPVLEEE